MRSDLLNRSATDVACVAWALYDGDLSAGTKLIDILTDHGMTDEAANLAGAYYAVSLSVARMAADGKPPSPVVRHMTWGNFRNRILGAIGHLMYDYSNLFTAMGKLIDPATVPTRDDLRAEATRKREAREAALKAAGLSEEDDDGSLTESDGEDTYPGF